MGSIDERAGGGSSGCRLIRSPACFGLSIALFKSLVTAPMGADLMKEEINQVNLNPEIATVIWC